MEVYIYPKTRMFNELSLNVEWIITQFLMDWVVSAQDFRRVNGLKAFQHREGAQGASAAPPRGMAPRELKHTQLRQRSDLLTEER